MENNIKSVKKIKYDYDLLKNHCEKYDIKLFDTYENIKITRETKILSECLNSNCNSIVNKSFRSLIDYGSYCTNCMKKNSNEKSFKNNRLKYSIKIYDYNLLKNHCEKKNIELLETYENIKITRDTKILSKCLNLNCNSVVNKSFRSLIDYGSYCTKCMKKNSNEKKEKEKQEKLEKQQLLKNNTLNYSIKIYDYNLLKNHCKKYDIKLLETYENIKITRETKILSKCLNSNCNSIVNKSFRSLIDYGSYCTNCMKKIINEKSKKTNLEKYGVEYSFNSDIVQNKIKKTNLEKYGCENSAGSVIIQDKIKKTNLEKYGCEYSVGSVIIQDKIKQINLEKYGCEKSFSSVIIQNKIKKTNLEKYGCENSLDSFMIQNKIKKTNLEKYGYENPFGSVIIQEKLKKINLEKYGCENSLDSVIIQNKIKKTNLEKYGYENPFGSVIIQEKIKKTNLEKYGVEHISQNPEIAEKASKNSYRVKEYKLPSNKIIKIQGYEPFAWNELLKIFDENQIKTGNKEVPEIWYEDKNNKKHRHFVDIFIPTINKCIEIKSTWTLKKNYEEVILKQESAKKLGYLYEIWVYDKKGKKVECLL